jgi:peptidoglycan/xylan/chitin deacetylase (PgdA/CDA1 family)
MDWIPFLARSRCPVVQAAVALLGPRAFLAAYYRRTLPRPQTAAGRLFALSLSFDIDHEEDVHALPALAAMLAARHLRASFAVIGALARRFPGPHRVLAADGFELINHTLNHPNHATLCPGRFFDRLPAEAMRQEVAGAHEAIREVCGVEARGFRAPHFGELHTDAVYPMLADLGYAWSSSTLSVRAPWGGLPARAQAGIVEFPVSTCPRHPHSVLDSWHALQRPRP